MTIPSTGTGGDVAARLRGVSKAFAGTKALDDVSLDLRRGEVHALLGSNGSGKSTLVKILAGVHGADSGVVEMGGESHDLRSFTPAKARACQLHFVHQERSVFSELTVAENLCLGRGFETGPGGRIRHRAVKERARAVLDRFEIDADPSQILGDLRPAAQTMVAIARALQDQDAAALDVLVLDEPTAALPPAEVELLLGALRNYATRGQAILFVSHRLDEVLHVADRVTVLRDGRRVACEARSEVDRERLVELIVGRPLRAFDPGERPAPSGSALLDARRVRGGVVAGATLAVHRGEVVGLTGLAGSGCSTIIRLLFGLQPLEGGTIELEGRAVEIARPSDAMRLGMACVPADRSTHAIFADLSVRENLTIASLADYRSRGRLRHGAERRGAREDVGRFGISAPSPDVPISDLSGGNQQKVVIGRWLRRHPTLLLLDEPTQGVDVGARADLWALVHDAARAGSGVLVASSDLDELALACDRVLVMQRGRFVCTLPRESLSADALVEAMHQTETAA